MKVPRIHQCVSAILVCLVLATAARAQHVETKVENAEVVYVEGNDVIVKFTDGEVRHFEIPDNHTFVIDGKGVTLHELRPGMKLTATITTTKPPMWVDTVKIIDVGTVWKIIGSNLIIKTPAGENEMYRVPSGGKITVDGIDKKLDQLREGDKITATVVSTRPLLAMNTTDGRGPRFPSTPARVGVLLIDEGAKPDEPPGTDWTPVIIACSLVLLLIAILILLALRKKRAASPE